MTTFYLILLACFGHLFTPIFGMDVGYCYIADPEKHERNQKLLGSILEQELCLIDPAMASSDKARHLNKRIVTIAEMLLKKGFSPEAYAIPAHDKNLVLSFFSFPLWEGDKNCAEPIPLTFFVYIWPPEELALKYNPFEPKNCYYASTIHSHPILCALAVLQGTLIQKNYERVSFNPLHKVVRFIDEEQFQQGQGSVDDLETPFIHQLYCRSNGSKPCLSLHAYGLSSAEKVLKCFKETLPQCTYEHVLQKDCLAPKADNFLQLQHFRKDLPDK